MKKIHKMFFLVLTIFSFGVGIERKLLSMELFDDAEMNTKCVFRYEFKDCIYMYIWDSKLLFASEKVIEEMIHKLNSMLQKPKKRQALWNLICKIEGEEIEILEDDRKILRKNNLLNNNNAVEPLVSALVKEGLKVGYMDYRFLSLEELHWANLVMTKEEFLSCKPSQLVKNKEVDLWRFCKIGKELYVPEGLLQETYRKIKKLSLKQFQMLNLIRCGGFDIERITEQGKPTFDELKNKKLVNKRAEVSVLVKYLVEALGKSFQELRNWNTSKLPLNSLKNAIKNRDIKIVEENEERDGSSTI